MLSTCRKCLNSLVKLFLIIIILSPCFLGNRIGDCSINSSNDIKIDKNIKSFPLKITAKKTFMTSSHPLPLPKQIIVYHSNNNDKFYDDKAFNMKNGVGPSTTLTSPSVYDFFLNTENLLALFSSTDNVTIITPTINQMKIWSRESKLLGGHDNIIDGIDDKKDEDKIILDDTYCMFQVDTSKGM